MTIEVPCVEANVETASAFGTYIGSERPTDLISIPFYEGSVIEGQNLPFEYRGSACLRTAWIDRRDPYVEWLEHHKHLTQLFIGLGNSPFGMVVGPPSDPLDRLPDLRSLRVLKFQPGSGILLHRGTWHDFPFAMMRPLSCLTANSAEVIEALRSQATASEMEVGDIRKVSVAKRYGMQIKLGV